MDVIEMARELGRTLQKEECYQKMRAASDACDKDDKLQGMIGEFNLKRMNINEEMQKPEQDQAKLQQMNNELRALYSRVMENPNMAVYNEVKTVMDTLLQRVSAIIGQCADGGDPDTADYEESSCGGNCSSCGGCH